MKRRSALLVGTNGRYREEDVIPSEANGRVEESVGKTGGRAAICVYLRDLRFLLWVGGNS